MTGVPAVSTLAGPVEVLNDAGLPAGVANLVPAAINAAKENAPIIFIGTQPDRPWCPAWGYHRTEPGNPAAEEPPEGHWLWEIWRIWDELAQQPDPEAQNEMFAQILDIWAEELPMIGYLGESPAPIIVKNGFRNYLPGMPIDDSTGDEHLLHTETYFWDDPESHT